VFPSTSSDRRVGGRYREVALCEALGQWKAPRFSDELQSFVRRARGGILATPKCSRFPGATRGRGRRWGVQAPSSWPPYRCVHADSRVSGLKGGVLRNVVLALRRRALGCSQSRSGNRAWQGELLSAEVGSSIGVLGLRRWLQKSVRGIRSREAILVAAGAGDGGLAQGGFVCWKAKGCLESDEPETVSSTKNLRRVACWRKTFGTKDAFSLHGLLAERVLASWRWRLRLFDGDTDVRATALTNSTVVTSRCGCARLSGEVSRVT